MDFEYTTEYLENKNFERLTAQRKYVKTGLRHLMKHIKEEQILHPKQIQFITKSILEIALYFEKEALKAYNELPDDIKQENEEYYQEHLAFTPKPEYSSRQTPPDIIKAFNERFEDNIKRAHKDAITYLENN